jgi:hypothetical protein
VDRCGGSRSAVRWATRAQYDCRGRAPGRVGRLSWALSWLVVVASWLAPILVYRAAGVIGRAFRRKRGARSTGSEPLEGQREGSEQSGAGGSAGLILTQPPADWRRRPGTGRGSVAISPNALQTSFKKLVG